MLTREQALEQAKALARAERDQAYLELHGPTAIPLHVPAAPLRWPGSSI